MIWIIGGTSEARELIDRLADLDNNIVTVATEAGIEFTNTDRLFVGRLNKKEMIEFVKNHNICMIVDLSHPYANMVSENAKQASEELGIKYLRYIRKKVATEYGDIYLHSYEECYEYIANLSGTIFFTTGSKNIGDFEKIKGNNRFIYRVLPALESIEICREHSLKLKDIIAILGPFSVDYNMIMFREYGVDYVIMKDSGEEGGTLNKIKACKKLGIESIIIGRKTEDGFHSLDSIEEIIRRYV